jgi:hypothetical protein
MSDYQIHDFFDPKVTFNSQPYGTTATKLRASCKPKLTTPSTKSRWLLFQFTGDIEVNYNNVWYTGDDYILVPINNNASSAALLVTNNRNIDTSPNSFTGWMTNMKLIELL